MSGSTSPFDAIPRLDGKTIVVTGANSGIGFEATRAFAHAGARVILACRSREKAAEAVARIHAQAPAAALEVAHLDLASLASVRGFAAWLVARSERLDALVNNAGVMALPLARTEDGFEMQLGTNHLGHFALTGLLFPALARSAPSRIVTVSSTMHRPGRMRWDDLSWQHGYRKWSAYAQSKLANLLFTFELDRRLRARGLAVRALACHPGYAATKLHLAGPTLQNDRLALFVMNAGNKLFARNALSGALAMVHAAVDAEAESGAFLRPAPLYDRYGPARRASPSRRAQDEEAAARLWTISEELTGVHFLD